MSDDSLQAAKLEALAEFAAGAGHEINNPVAAISGRVQLLLRDETDPDRRRQLITIGAQALRIRDMIGDVMLFARPPLPQPQRVELRSTVENVIATFGDSLAERRLHVYVSGSREQDVPVWADETQLRIVVSELLRNAMQFSPDGGEIRIECARRDDGTARLMVRDHGPGLSEVDREHLFDPFYSGRQAGRGLGFGLAKCWRIVALHGGRIRPVEEDGFAIVVDWPASPVTSPPDSAD